MLAHHFGGGPAYWLDPDLPDEMLATALVTLHRMHTRNGPDHE